MMTTVSGYSRTEMCDLFLKFCEKGEFASACSAAAEIVCTSPKAVENFIGFIIDTICVHGKAQHFLADMAYNIDTILGVPRRKDMIHNCTVHVGLCNLILITILALKQPREDQVSIALGHASERSELVNKVEALCYDDTRVKVPSIVSQIRDNVDMKTMRMLSVLVWAVEMKKKQVVMFIVAHLATSRVPIKDASWPDDVREGLRNDIVWVLWKIALDQFGYGAREYSLYSFAYKLGSRMKRIGLLLTVYSQLLKGEKNHLKSRLGEKERALVVDAVDHLSDIISELTGTDDDEEIVKDESGCNDNVCRYEEPTRRAKKKKIRSQRRSVRHNTKNNKCKENLEPIPVHMLVIPRREMVDVNKSPVFSRGTC